MATLKEVTVALTSWLQNHNKVNEVTFGDVTEADISTRTNFPLAHLIPLNTEFNENTTVHTYQLLVLSTFQERIEDKIDVLSDMNSIVSDLVSAFNIGGIMDFSYGIETSTTAQVMYDQMANRLYGYSLEFVITVAKEPIC
jgi:hypothetical protein